MFNNLLALQSFKNTVPNIKLITQNLKKIADTKVALYLVIPGYVLKVEIALQKTTEINL